MTDGMGLLDSEQLPALPSQPSGAPPLHLWRLGTGSSRFCMKKFPSSFSLRVKKFPSSFWLRVKSSPFCMAPGVKVPQKRGVSRGFWRVFSWPWPASWVSELPSSRFLMFSQRRPAPPSPLALPSAEGGILRPRHGDNPTLHCKVSGGVGEGASVSLPAGSGGTALIGGPRGSTGSPRTDWGGVDT